MEWVRRRVRSRSSLFALLSKGSGSISEHVIVRAATFLKTPEQSRSASTSSNRMMLSLTEPACTRSMRRTRKRPPPVETVGRRRAHAPVQLPRHHS